MVQRNYVMVFLKGMRMAQRDKEQSGTEVEGPGQVAGEGRERGGHRG